MSNAINLTPASIAEITRRITAKADEIEYEIYVPSEVGKAVAKGAPLMWAKILEFEYQYIDSVVDDGVLDEVLYEADFDIDSLVDANESYQIQQFFLPNGEGMPLSLEDFQVALSRAITDDLQSAWLDVIRRVIEGVHGEDPLGVGEGLTFPEGD